MPANTANKATSFPVIVAVDIYENPFLAWGYGDRSDIPRDLPKGLKDAVDRVGEPDGLSCTHCDDPVGMVTYDTSYSSMGVRWYPVRVVVDLNYDGKPGVVEYQCESCAGDSLFGQKGD